jgi:hypothetical protein
MANQDFLDYNSDAKAYNAAMDKQQAEIAAAKAAKTNQQNKIVTKDVENSRKKYGYGDVCKPPEMMNGKSICGSCKAVEGGTARIITHYFGCPCKEGGKRRRTKKSKRRSKSRSKKVRKTRRV